MKKPLAGLTKVKEEQVFNIDLSKSLVMLGDLVLEQDLVFRIGEETA